MDWKRNFLESSLLGQSTPKNDPKKVELKCIQLAYGDMMNAGRYYSELFLNTKDKILTVTQDILQRCDYAFSRELIQRTAFQFCEAPIIKTSASRYVTSYGLAQKLVNMTFKYFYIFSDYIFKDRAYPDFSLCDCPLDSIILDKAKIKGCVWSKLTAQQYEDCQDKIATLLKQTSLDAELTQLGNLAFDFINW